MVMQKKERVIFLIDEIKERIAALQGTSNESLNMDIILEDLRFVYREVELLKLKAISPEIIKEVEDNNPTVEAILKEQAIEEEKPADETSSPTEDIKVFPPPFNQKFENNDDSKAIEKEPAIIEDNEEIQSPQQAREDEPNIDATVSAKGADNSSLDVQVGKSPLFVADKLRVEDNSLYKKFLLENEDKSIGSRMQVTPIKSIKEAIGLNEKFLFINELFSGNIQDYNIAVEKLNGFENLEGAFDYLNQLGQNCDWDFDRSENTIRMLVNLVQRRYLKH